MRDRQSSLTASVGGNTTIVKCSIDTDAHLEETMETGWYPTGKLIRTDIPSSVNGFQCVGRSCLNVISLSNSRWFQQLMAHHWCQIWGLFAWCRPGTDC